MGQSWRHLLIVEMARVGMPSLGGATELKSAVSRLGIHDCEKSR